MVTYAHGKKPSTWWHGVRDLYGIYLDCQAGFGRYISTIFQQVDSKAVAIKRTVNWTAVCTQTQPPLLSFSCHVCLLQGQDKAAASLLVPYQKAKRKRSWRQKSPGLRRGSGFCSELAV